MVSKLLFLALFLVGCSHIQKPQGSFVNIGGDARLYLKEPKDILPEIQLNQILNVEHQGKKNSSQVILTSKDNKLSMVALLPFGGEAFRVEYAKGEIVSKSLPAIGSGLDLKFALADVILVYADRSALQNWVSEGVGIVDSGQQRVITDHSKPIIVIRYSTIDKFAATVEYEHLIRAYRIQIQPIPMEKL